MIDNLPEIATGLGGVAAGASGWVLFILKSLQRRIEINENRINNTEKRIDNFKDEIKDEVDVIGDKQDRMITYLIMVADNDKAAEVLGDKK